MASNLIAEKGAEALYKNNPEKLAIAKGNIGFMGVCATAVPKAKVAANIATPLLNALLLIGFETILDTF